MDQLIHDFKYSLRLMVKHWGVSLIVVFSIALGASANSVVFGYVEGFILNPLPAVANTDRLYAFSSKTRSDDYINSSYADFVEYRKGLSDLGVLMLYKSWPVNLDSGGRIERVPAMLASQNYFEALNLQPATGRFFRDDDQIEVSGGKPVVVISHDYWASRYSKDPDVVGDTLVLNQLPYTIIGVAPAEFKGTEIGGSYDLWLPLMQMSRLSGSSDYWITDRKTRPFAAILGINQGVSADTVKTRLDVIANRLESTYPDTNAGISAVAFPFVERPEGGASDLSLLLSVLFLASVVVLSIICANLINLLLARSTEREKEVGIRKAVGSGGAGIMRLFVVEGLTMSAIAAVISIVAVHLLYDFLQFFSSDLQITVADSTGLSSTLVFYTITLALLMGAVISALPAIRSASVDVGDVVKESSRGSSVGRRTRYLRTLLIICEVALAFVALALAASFVKSFDRITDIEPGFEVERVHLAALTPTGPINERSQLLGFTDELHTGMQDLPGVRAVAFAEFVPLGLSGGSWEDISVRGYAPSPDENMKIYRNFVSEQYFDVMDIAIVDGRAFGHQDGPNSELVTVVNATFAERYFSGRDPVGRTIIGWGREIQVVGVAENSKYRSPTESPRPYLYLPFRQFASTGSDVIMHTSLVNPEMDIGPTVRNVVGRSGSLMYVTWMSSLQTYTGASVFNERILAVLLTLLGATALVLSALGIYGVVSHSVSQRTHEIGVRIALGASVSSILKMILIQSLKTVLIGIAVGILLYLSLWQGIRDMIYGVDSIELSTLLLVSLMLVLLAIMASFAPALRIGKLDPVKALSET